MNPGDQVIRAEAQAKKTTIGFSGIKHSPSEPQPISRRNSIVQPIRLPPTAGAPDYESLLSKSFASIFSNSSLSGSTNLSAFKAKHAGLPKSPSKSKMSYDERLFAQSSADVKRLSIDREMSEANSLPVAIPDEKLPISFQNNIKQTETTQSKSKKQQKPHEPKRETGAQGQSFEEKPKKINVRTHETTKVKRRPSADKPVVYKEQQKRKIKVENAQALHRKPAQKPVPLFSHLMQFEKENNTQADLKAQGVIHPAVLSLGLQFSDYFITGGNARCMAMLVTFKKVVSDYITPNGTSLQRNMTSYISKQVDFLSNSRALAASMKTAIRFLKNEISTLSIDLPDEDAKLKLCESIDDFIRDRIVYAGNVITREALESKRIKDGDTILTFARSSIVESVLLEALATGIKFRVIVVDARPKLEGKELLYRLSQAGITCTFVTINAVPFVMKEVSKVILGASSVLSNGAILARAGTAIVAMCATESMVPVIVLCETYKFSEQVRLDSIVWNEIGDPDELVDISVKAPSKTIPSTIPYFTSKLPGVLKNWRDIPQLKLLALNYDVTPAKFITMVICELGCIPSTSVLTILREHGSRD